MLYTYTFGPFVTQTFINVTLFKALKRHLRSDRPKRRKLKNTKIAQGKAQTTYSRPPSH